MYRCIYYALVTPLAFFVRLCGLGKIEKGFTPRANSYWHERERRESAPETMASQR